MEIIGKIFFAILFVVGVVLVSVIVLFSAIAIEFKVLMRRNRKIKEQLTTQELRLLELTNLIIKSASLVNSHISELMSKRVELQDRKCRCTNLPTNNIDNQK